MSVREQYEQKAEAMAQPIIDQFGFELVDVELSLIHISEPTRPY